MKFSFSYGGGFTGLNYAFNGDTDDLDAAEKAQLEAVLKMEQHNIKESNPQAKDMFNYKLAVGEGTQQVSLNFKDDNMPAELDSLISFLRQKATLT